MNSRKLLRLLLICGGDVMVVMQLVVVVSKDFSFHMLEY